MFHTDNQGLVEVINRKTTKDRQLLDLLRELVLQCLKHNILFRAIHVPGVLNVKADAFIALTGHAIQVPRPGYGSCPNARASPSSTTELASVTRHLLSASLSKGSKDVYKRSWSLFVAWAQAYLGNCNFNLPLQSAVLALFVSYLYSLRYASSTVTSYLSAISYAHRLAGVNDPTETALITQILKGYSKLTPAHEVRLPITLPIFKQIIASYQHTTGSAYQLQMLTAMCSLAFFAFIRIGDITVNGKDHNNLIRLPQLESLVNDKRQVIALQLTILQYKHSNNGRPLRFISIRKSLVVR